MLKKLIFMGVMCSAGLVLAQDITGKWRTFDDSTKKPKAVVQITGSGGVYNGRIVSLEPGVDPNCGTCSGSVKGKPLVGSSVVRNLKLEDGSTTKYTGGSITDPKNGKTYKAYAELTNGGNTLRVRGYIGVAAAGRTQVWQRVQ